MKLLAFSFLFLSTIGFAQVEMPTVIPPSPDAAALAKYGEIPVSYYTGTPDISIPIHTIKVKDITIPISLKYHSGGFKVEEESSWVGLGWTLHAGGMITRTVRDKDDLYYKTLFTYRGVVESLIKVDSECKAEGELQDYFSLYDYYKSEDHLDIHDFDYDIFYFNFLNYSGSFLIDNDNKIYLLNNKQNINIEFTNSQYKDQGFLITTPDGMEYDFAYGGNVCDNMCLRPIVNRWNLLSIKSPMGEIVEFHYNHQQQIKDFKYSSSEIIYHEEPTISSCISPLFWSDFYNEELYRYSSSASTYKEKLISMITYNNGKGEIKFGIAEEERKDLKGGIILDNITIKEAERKRIFKLNHSYFKSKFTDDPNDLRLKLVSMYHDDLPPYLFTYNRNILPPKNSDKVDPWGYYNGSGDIRYLEKAIYNKQNDYLNLKNGVSINGPLDTVYSKACILEKILYPTGGSTNFQFEQHTYGRSRYENGQIKPIPEEDSELIIAEANVFANKDGKKLTDSDQYEIKGYEPIPVEVEYYIQRDEVLVNHGDDAMKWEEFFKQFRVGHIISKTAYGDDTDGEIVRARATMKPGSFNLIAEMPEGVYGKAGIKVIYNHKNYGGGLRIKRIISDDNNGNKMEKNYYYGLLDPDKQETKSYGKIMGKPNFLIDYDRTFSNASQSAKFKFIMSKSFSIVPLGYVQGSSVGYDQVMVEENGGKSHYYYLNDSEAQVGFSLVSGLPNVKRPTNGLIKGQKDYKFEQGNENLHKYDPNNYKLIREVINIYDMKSSKAFFGNFLEYNPLAVATRNNIGGEGVLGCNLTPDIVECADGFIWLYPVIRNVEWNVLSSKIEKLYNEESINENELYAQTITNYEYHNDIHQQPTFTSKIKSDGTKEITYTLYNADYSENSSISNLPREMVTYNEATGKITDASVFNYAYASGALSSYSKIEDKNLNIADFRFSNRENEGELPFEDGFLSFFSTDNKYVNKFNVGYKNGNAINTRKANDVSTAYIYGYDDLYPVAKIENAKIKSGKLVDPNNEEIIFLSIENVSAIEDFSGTLDEWLGKLSELRSALSDHLVTTYTYEPYVGITSQTDPNGLTTYYEYDDYERLVRVLDSDKNIIKSYDYEYLHAEKKIQ